SIRKAEANHQKMGKHEKNTCWNRCLQTEDKVVVFLLIEKNRFFVRFESFSWDKHRAASLRCWVAPACFSLGSDYERTNAFSFILPGIKLA
ncbi:MAG: hypothetical protein ACRC00_01055, partial [Exiguobacterium acetylicum]